MFLLNVGLCAHPPVFKFCLCHHLLQLLGTFLFLLISLHTPVSQPLLSLVVGFACFQFSRKDQKDSLLYCPDGQQTWYVPNSTIYCKQMLWAFSLKNKGNNTKFKQIYWTNFPWSFCCAHSNQMFSNLGDQEIPGHQLLLVYTNRRQPSTSLLQVGGRWKIIRGNKKIQKIQSFILKKIM